MNSEQVVKCGYLTDTEAVCVTGHISLKAEKLLGEKRGNNDNRNIDSTPPAVV